MTASDENVARRQDDPGPSVHGGGDRGADQAEKKADQAEKVVELERKVSQLERAVESHAAVDQAIGIVVAVGKLTPDQGWTVLRETSQHTNTKLSRIADMIVAWGCAGDLPEEIRRELDASLARAQAKSNCAEAPG
ncbi:ANTAR domain-containing protein [Streptomyces alfalfae]|uniref:ANTAR domain-containing protein n=1 Tax=Streptomyces alfalfae TaxID=1642299 RepID=UPI0026AA37AB|nr:ANTAR domain-containing protein [Streptomyces alfalfae]